MAAPLSSCARRLPPYHPREPSLLLLSPSYSLLPRRVVVVDDVVLWERAGGLVGDQGISQSAGRGCRTIFDYRRYLPHVDARILIDAQDETKKEQRARHTRTALLNARRAIACREGGGGVPEEPEQVCCTFCNFRVERCGSTCVFSS